MLKDGLSAARRCLFYISRLLSFVYSAYPFILPFSCFSVCKAYKFIAVDAFS